MGLYDTSWYLSFPGNRTEVTLCLGGLLLECDRETPGLLILSSDIPSKCHILNLLVMTGPLEGSPWWDPGFLNVVLGIGHS